MRKSGTRGGWMRRGTIGLAALAGLAEAASGGTGRLVSHWMSRAPRIDGQIAAGEWSDAVAFDLGAGVAARIGNDARTLYVSVVDSGDAAFGNGDGLAFYFDDEGGTPPVLDDSAYGGSGCLPTPDLGEGVIYTTGAQDAFYQLYFQGFSCPAENVSTRLTLRATAQPGGVTYEMAIPLDGPAPLRAGGGRRFGFSLRSFRGFSPAGCYPTCANTDPAAFRNLSLASGGCNTGPQDFGAGSPPAPLPLDWTNDVQTGGGPGWVQAPPPFFGDPVFCDANDTGGTGGAACVANFDAATTPARSVLSVPLALAGQEHASLRGKGVLVVDPNGGAALDYLDVCFLLQDGSGSCPVDWWGQNHSATWDLHVPLGGSLPVELWFEHATGQAGGLEGGYAQIDDIELICGPVLFADGFDSGWATHWSADVP